MICIFRNIICDVTYTLRPDALVYSSLPTILVSCKCDNPVNTRQIDTESIQAACLAEVETVKTASNVPESARLCLGAMLRAVMASRNGQSLNQLFCNWIIWLPNGNAYFCPTTSEYVFPFVRLF